MRDISNVCCLNTFAITTKTARILDSGREHQTVEAPQQPLLTSTLMSDSVGCIIATIGLPEARLFRNRALEFSLQYRCWTGGPVLRVLLHRIYAIRKDFWLNSCVV